MGKTRLEAFSDGVIAIILTIMVLELKVPLGGGWSALRPLVPVFMSYVLSFIYIGIYWNNHHHMLQAVEKVNGRVLWANLHLLFWLSLIPVATGWMGENRFSSLPVAIYGIVLFMAGCAFTILSRSLIASQGNDSRLAAALGRDAKGRASILIYAIAVPLAFVHPVISCLMYVFVALMWFIPDPRIEHTLMQK